MNSKNFPGKWEFPGGKVDAGERFEAALVREAREETGLEVIIKRFIGAAKSEMPRITAIQLVMEVEAAPGTPMISHEHEALTWATTDEMLSMDLVDWMKPFIRRYLLSDHGTA